MKLRTIESGHSLEAFYQAGGSWMDVMGKRQRWSTPVCECWLTDVWLNKWAGKDWNLSNDAKQYTVKFHLSWVQWGAQRRASAPAQRVAACGHRHDTDAFVLFCFPIIQKDGCSDYLQKIKNAAFFLCFLIVVGSEAASMCFGGWK